MGEDAAPTPDQDTTALLRGDPFAGLGSYQAVTEYEWWRPLRLGDRCRVLQTQVGVQVKPTRFGGRTAHVTRDYVSANGDGELHAVRRGTRINAERHSSKGWAKERIEPRPYTAEQLAEIDAALLDTTHRVLLFSTVPSSVSRGRADCRSPVGREFETTSRSAGTE